MKRPDQSKVIDELISTKLKCHRDHPPPKILFSPGLVFARFFSDS